MYYRRHVFFCTNRHENGKPCCEDHDASAAWMHAKAEIQSRGLAGPGGVRVNRSGCLGRCAEGPTVVVYPEGVWYSYRSEADVDEIIERHLVGGEVVEHLRI